MSDLMLMPLPFNAELLVFGIAVAYTFASIALQRTLTSPKKTREIQERMQGISKELNDMLKNNASQDEIKAKQAELMPLMSTSMKSQFKPMLVILPLFFVLYSWIFPYVFVSAVQVQFLIYKGSPAQIMFLVIASVLGITSSLVILAYDKKKAKEEKKALENSSASSSNITV